MSFGGTSPSPRPEESNGTTHNFRKPTATAAELRKALSSVDIAGAEALVTALEEDRRLTLIAEDDRALEAIDVKITAAHRALEHAVAGEQEWSKRIAEAEQREGDEAYAKARAAAERNARHSRRSCLRSVPPSAPQPKH